MQNEKFCMVFAWLSANLLLFDKSRALMHSHARAGMSLCGSAGDRKYLNAATALH
jgi:hypothetical protein